MMSYSEADAREILAPHIYSLQHCVTAGLSEYNSIYGPIRHVHSPHSRAMLIRDHIIAQVRKMFDKVDGVKIINKNGLFLLSIDDKLFLRFKKMNEKMLTRNHPTRQACCFAGQLSFEGFFSPVTNLNVGYIPNDVWTYPNKVIITCPNGIKSNKWYIDLTEDGIGLISNIMPITGDSVAENRRRVKAKVMKEQTGT